MSDIAGRLHALRSELAARDLAGFVIPLTDEHQSEYVSDYAKRLAFMTDFTGSAGQAIVHADAAAVFVDGRYTVQVREQVDEAQYEIRHLMDQPPVDWLVGVVRDGDAIGYDPFLHTVGWVRTARQKLAARGATLIAVDGNPIDDVWTDQPAEPNRPVVPHATEFAGKSSQVKRHEIAAAITEFGADAAVFTQLDSVAWLFNIRSGDVENTPVSLAFAILSADGKGTLYLDPSKVTSELKAHLGNEVAIARKDEFLDGLTALGEAGKRVIADPMTASAAVFGTLDTAGATVVKSADPVALPKAIKNATEVAGMRAAHLRDGAALTDYLAWLDVEAPKGGLDELSAAAKLRSFREAHGDLKDLSFRTISAAGPHGALPHYSVDEQSNRPLNRGELYLVDSGGQYDDGTTDVTRTIPVGAPTDEMCDRFTRVLRGHIAIATARFPAGTNGTQLDSFARRPLWEAGLDYDHGTGHGVGCYLAVHEGPQRIAKAPNDIALEPGMIVSNEPGYYKEGEFGIRIENLEVVVEKDPGGGEKRRMLGFESLTRAPIDRRLVKVELLDDRELAWLNDYHQTVKAEILPLVKGATAEWLVAATAPIGR